MSSSFASSMFGDSAPSDRRVLSREAAIALGQKLLTLVNKKADRVLVEHVAHSVTKVANGSVLAMEDGDVVKIQFPSTFGSGLPLWISTNQLNDATLRQVVNRAMAMAPASESAPDEGYGDDRAHWTFNPRPLPPVSLWHDATAQAMDTARGATIPKMVEQLRSSGLTGAATVRLMTRSTLYLYQLGLTSFAEETDSELTVTARTPDNTASGWSGQAHRDWGRIAPTSVVERAIDMANRSRNPVALEPGRRVAILGVAAVAQLVYAMAQFFSFFSATHGGPLAFRGSDRKGRSTKMGLRIFDPRLMMVSDPADQDGGYPPFFEKFGSDGFHTGFPTPAVTWINRGVLERLAMDVSTAVERGLSPAEEPYAVRIATVPGTVTATLDEMIANCREGVYVNRFSDVRSVDRTTGMLTGVTRDGCFLIKDGKITKSLTNFRFTESPFFAFNQLEMIGTPERSAFGSSSTPSVTMIRSGLPRLPIIVPPMMIKDFNFSALANAV